MMKYVHVLLLITGICLAGDPVLGEEKHWTYSGHEDRSTGVNWIRHLLSALPEKANHPST